MRKFITLWTLLVVAALAPAIFPGSAQSQGLSPEILKGDWSGEWAVRETRNKISVAINDVTADGKIAGTMHIGNASGNAPSYHNKDLPVTGTYSTDGKVTLGESNTTLDLQFRPPNLLYGKARGARATADIELVKKS